MKLFIFLIFLAAFLQTSFLPLNLCLVLIICRSLIVDDKAGLFLAFGAGILLGLLYGQNIGFWPAVFLLVSKVVGMVRGLPVMANYLTILPLSFALVLLVSWLQSLFFRESFYFINALLTALASLPVFFLLKLWEERFIVRDIKLKIRHG